MNVNEQQLRGLKGCRQTENPRAAWDMNVGGVQGEFSGDLIRHITPQQGRRTDRISAHNTLDYSLHLGSSQNIVHLVLLYKKMQNRCFAHGYETSFPSV